MGRAKTKTELLSSAKDKFEKMWSLIDSMSEAQQMAPFAKEMATAGKEAHWSRDKNLRDILIHLYEWHQLLLNWVIANQSGTQKPFLPKPYNWKTYPEMNIKFWEKHQDTSLTSAKTLVFESHKEIMAIISEFSDDELFTKGIIPWATSTTLGSYCVSATASHYDWAIKKIKLHIKTSQL